jgi:hypothetical protein
MWTRGFNSSINGQLSLKYRFARALSRWDGEHPAIIEDEVTYLAYRSRLNDSLSKSPGRTLVKENILLGIFKRLGLNGLAEENCCFVALTWDTRANVFFQSKGVPSDCLPVFLDSAGADVYSNSDSPAWELNSTAIVFASNCGRGIGLPALYRAEIGVRSLP